MDNLDERDSDFNLKQNIENVVFLPNHPLMAKTRLREQDQAPQRIFFYLKMNEDKIVYYTEQEAHLMEKSSFRFLLRQVGVSDGSGYRKVILNCGVRTKSLIPREKAQEILNEALQAEIKLAKTNFKKTGYTKPMPQNIHFDNSFPLEQRAGFVPPA